MNDAHAAKMLHQQGLLAKAEASYRSAIDCLPNDNSLRHDYGILLMQLRREKEAAAQLEAIEPDSSEYRQSTTALALCLRAIGQTEKSLAIALEATTFNPGDPVAWMILGSQEVASGLAQRAELSLRRCLSIAPGMGEAWHYLGEALQAQQRWTEAAHAYQTAARDQPTEIFNVAICAENSGQLTVAREGYMKMMQLHPGNINCIARLAHVQALLCDFPGQMKTTELLEKQLQLPASGTDMDIAEPFPASYLPLSDASKRVVLQRYADRVKKRAYSYGSIEPPLPDNTPGRIRIGYISADFGPHAVGRLIRGLFSAHDRNVVEVYGYSLRTTPPTEAHEIQKDFDCFRECGPLSNKVIAQQISQDRIDVLVDLGGYTNAARPEILALKPAKVQLGWLGFIHAHQADWLDGILMDEFICPEESPWPYSDKIIRLPSITLPACEMKSGVSNRSRFGLPEDAPLLASFNNTYKLDEALLRAWVEILRRAPAAYLLVYLPDQARAGFDTAWKLHNGDPTRLLMAGNLSYADQADRAASCDLFLDAFRYQAGATGISAAASGLPILCMSGSNPLSRLSASLNRYIGMDELICHSIEEYIEKAAMHANSPETMINTKARNRQCIVNSRLLDPYRSAGEIESLCQTLIWK